MTDIPNELIQEVAAGGEIKTPDTRASAERNEFLLGTPEELDRIMEIGDEKRENILTKGQSSIRSVSRRFDANTIHITTIAEIPTSDRTKKEKQKIADEVADRYINRIKTRMEKINGRNKP